ncbi:hypothetical protein [Legionella antarctica]|nr:hypothetical protein [Legionella antarctica]
MLQAEKPDFYIINCQEVAVEATLRQLQKAAGKGYTVVCIGQMATHTKLSTQFHSGTGIATFIIHNDDIEVDCQTTQVARRSNSRLSGGSGFNKGGLITDFTVARKIGDKIVHLQAISGHLESNDTQKRIKDWHNINQTIAKEVTNWENLVDACPDLIVSGYDANTRNKLNDNGEAENLWIVPGGTSTPEIQALHQAALGGQHFSDPSTYKTELEDITEIEDKKRPGYTRGGMLDFVSIADGGEPSSEITVDGVIKIKSNAKDSARDHDVIICPAKEYPLVVNDFARVRGQIAMRLERSAPSLAKEIRGLTDDNAESKNQLIQVYQQFLSPKGLLNNSIALHIQKLASLNRLTDPAFLQDEKLKKLITETLFPATAWFESAHLASNAESAKQLNQKLELMHLLLTSLSQCPSQFEVEKRITLYAEQVQNIEGNTYNAQTAADTFKELQVIEYWALYAELKANLLRIKQNNPYTKDLLEQGMEILGHMNAIIPNADKARELDSHSMAQLGRVLRYSSQAIETLDNHGDITPLTIKLTALAQDVSGKSSPDWRKLGRALVVFACLALVVAGVLAAIPTAGSSLILALMGAGAVAGALGLTVYEFGEEEGLAKAVLDYKTAVENIVTDERSIDEDPEEDTYGGTFNNS